VQEVKIFHSTIIHHYSPDGITGSLRLYCSTSPDSLQLVWFFAFSYS